METELKLFSIYLWIFDKFSHTIGTHSQRTYTLVNVQYNFRMQPNNFY